MTRIMLAGVNFTFCSNLLKNGGIMEDTRTRHKLGIVSKAKISLFAVKLVQADL